MVVEKIDANPYVRLEEDLPYDEALKMVMAGNDFEVGIRRMDEKHRSPKPLVPDTKFLTKQDGILWRVTEGGGRAGRVGKGRDKKWYTLSPSNPHGKGGSKKSESKPKAKAKAKTKKRAVAKSKMGKAKQDLDALFNN